MYIFYKISLSMYPTRQVVKLSPSWLRQWNSRLTVSRLVWLRPPQSNLHDFHISIATRYSVKRKGGTASDQTRS